MQPDPTEAVYRLILALVLGMLSAGTAAARGPGDISRPNILFILADDLGRECLGSYGGTSYETPALDSLAASGCRYTNCFSTPKCSPTRVTYLTGRYTFRTTNEWGYIPPAEITVGQVLRRAGYATALAGKWQLGLMKEDPLRVRKAGFDESCIWAWHEGPRYWKPMIYRNGEVMEGIDDRYGPDIYCGFLADFIKRHRDGPFFATYSMTLTHWPKSDEPKGPNGRWETYAEMVSAMDERVGRLVTTLERLELRKKTLVLFTGDNGSPRNVRSRLGDREVRGGKATLLDAGTRVPLIASWPGAVAPGTVSPVLIDFTDFFPTFCELAGAKPPSGVTIDGHSFAPGLRGACWSPREWVYTEWQGRSWIRDERWKLYGDGKLFDMNADPEEKEPVGADGAGEDALEARKRLGRALEKLKSR